MMDERPEARDGWRAVLGEIVISVAAATLLPLACRHIRVDPMDRIGQVSGLSAIELRFTVVAIALVVALAVAARVRGGRGFSIASRLACAAVAGLATGIIAGGILVALRGTHYGLNGLEGDMGRIVDSADAIRRGEDVPLIYPPLSLHGLAWYAELFNMKTAFAMKDMQVIGTAALGPATYLAWRLILRPTWALGVGLVAALPLIDSAPYKSYSVLVLLVFIPISIRFLIELRSAASLSLFAVARRGIGFGLVFGVLCLLYSGWFKWSAPGLLVAGAVVFPWRSAVGRGALMVGLLAACFALVAGPYIYAVLTDIGQIDDKFIYFDALTEPTYIAMFGGDLPASDVWPPLGELGGVGLFTIIMALGFGGAIAYGRNRTEIIVLGSVVGGTWLARFWYAHFMFKTKLVQLYPRTTSELLYCILAMCGLTVYYAAERARTRADAESPLLTPSGVIGGLCGLMMLLGSAGSVISNRYMPNNYKQMSFGILAYNAHTYKVAMPVPLPMVKK